MLCLTPRTVMAVVAAVALAACGGEVEYTEAAPSAPQTNPAAKLSRDSPGSPTIKSA